MAEETKMVRDIIIYFKIVILFYELTQGWGYFPDYDEVGTVASLPESIAQETTGFNGHEFNQLQSLIKMLKRKTKPGYEHHEALAMAFRSFDVEEDGLLTEEQLFKGLSNYLGNARLTVADSNLFFQYLDDNQNGAVSLAEFIDGVCNFAKQKPVDQDQHGVYDLIDKLKRCTRPVL